MIERHGGRRPREQKLMQPSASVFFAQVFRKIVGQQIWAVCLVHIAPVDFSETVVQGGVERADCDQSTEFRDRLGEMQIASYLRSGVEVRGLECEIEINGMTVFP